MWRRTVKQVRSLVAAPQVAGRSLHSQTSLHAGDWWDNYAEPQYPNPCQVFDSRTGEKRSLETEDAHKITWYQCGPTVYDDAHLGHGTSYIRFDIIKRILRVMEKDKIIVQVMGITDVDDKIIQRAKDSQTPWQELSRKYEARFFEDMRALNVEPPTIVARVSEHIPDILNMIKGIEAQKCTVVGQDNTVRFDVDSFGPDHYDFLTSWTSQSNDQEEAQSNDLADANKRNFALWKPSPIDCDERFEPSWESPWGAGRPGWHIECSAMASKYLGSKIDIHTGGEDLKHPHHTNEQAQSECYHKTSDWVTHFMHSGHLTIRSAKMSKSLGNSVTIRDFLKEYTANDLRMICLTRSYRARIAFNDDLCKAAQSLNSRFSTFLQRAEKAVAKASQVPRNTSDLNDLLREARSGVESGLLDDFDTISVINTLSQLVTKGNRALDDGISPEAVWQLAAFLRDTCSTLGLEYESTSKIAGPDDARCKGDAEKKIAQLERVVNGAQAMRHAVRQAAFTTTDKETKRLLFAAVDAFRDEAASQGVALVDDSVQGKGKS
eukprot:m.240314 g.240314  ORF g.240314 m.240314 type:complete len:549 (+) comp15307_c0_seq1:61-1707(+)